ncbi:glycosyltransferase family 2 protein, partial [Ornithinicoccus hortensis]
MMLENLPPSLLKPLKKVWRQVVPEGVRRELYARRTEKDQILLSVVVPVYKVEEYLNPCIESIVEQSYRNLEIILVDDGSPDSCGAMCDAWKREDDRIKVLHQVNGGLSNARNNGAKLATGKYLSFVDSDDIVPKDAFRLLVESLEITGSDISTGNVQRFQGGRRWQAWNQTYSHRRDNFGTLGQDHKVARAVTLESHPELLFDTTAWNKVFRRNFFRRSKITFPEGKLYEDMLPMAQAFSAARSIDVVLDTTYLYREREDKTSITQKRGEVNNLRDKMEMVDRILDLRLGLGAPGKEVQTIVFKALEGDLPVYSPYLGRAKDFDAIYMRSLKKYWGLASRETKDRLALDRRVLYLTQLFGDPSEAETNAGEVRNRFHEIPIIAGDAGLVADIDWDPRLLGVLAPGDDASMERYVYLRQCITDARVAGGRMQMTGFAFLEYVPDPQEATIEVYLRNDERATVSLEPQPFPSPEANGYWGSGLADRTECGFRIDQSLDSIFGDVLLASTQRWDVWVKVQYRGRSWESVASGYWRGGAIRAGVSTCVGPAHHGMFSWQPWGKPLAFVTLPPRAEVLEVRVHDDLIDIELSPTEERITGAAMTRLWDSSEVRGKLLGTGKHGGLRVQFDTHDMAHRGEAGGNLNAWRPSVTLDDGSTLYPSCATDSSSLPTESAGWEVRNNSAQELLLIDKCCLFEVGEARFEANRLILAGINFGDDTMEHKGEFWDADGNKVRHCEFINLENGRFEIRANLEVKDRFGNTAAWKPGEYRIRLWHADGTHCKQRVRSSTALLQSALPLEWTGSLCHGRLHVLSDTLE